MVRHAEADEVKTRLYEAVDGITGIDWLDVTQDGSRIEVVVCGRSPATDYVAGGEALATVSTMDGDSFDVATGTGAQANHEVTKLAATGCDLAEALEVAADYVRR